MQLAIPKFCFAAVVRRALQKSGKVGGWRGRDGGGELFFSLFLEHKCFWYQAIIFILMGK